MNYSVQQFVQRTQQWEPLRDGTFPTLQEAENHMRQLEYELGWRHLNVHDKNGNVALQGTRWDAVPPVNSIEELQHALLAMEKHGAELTELIGSNPFEENFERLIKNLPNFGGTNPGNQDFSVHVCSWDLDKVLIKHRLTLPKSELVSRNAFEIAQSISNQKKEALSLHLFKNPSYSDIANKLISEALADQKMPKNAVYKKSDYIFQKEIDGMLETYAVFGDKAYNLDCLNCSHYTAGTRYETIPILINGEVIMEEANDFQGIAVMFLETHQQGRPLSKEEKQNLSWTTYFDCKILNQLQKTPNGDWIGIKDPDNTATDDATFNDSPSP